MASKTGTLIQNIPADATALDGSEFLALSQNNRTVKVTPMQIQTFVLGGTSCNMLCAQITLTSVQMLAINTTPQLIIAAPGENKVILPMQCYFLMRYDTATYSDGGLFTVYVDSDGSASVADTLFTRVASNSYANTNDVFGVLPITNITTGENVLINRGIYVTTSASDPTTGDSEVSIFMTYRILDLADVAS